MSQIQTKYVANNAITNAKLAQAPALTLLGNNSGSTANQSNLSVSQVNTMLGTILANGTVAFGANQSLGGFNLTNVADPSTAQMAATKSYVDSAVSALQPFTSVFAASTANVSGSYLNGAAGVGATFTTTSTATFTIDGTTPDLNSRILFKDQSTGFQNGIYNFTALPVGGISGAVFTRAFDYDTAGDMNAAGLIPVINGTVNALSSWQQTAVITTVGSNALVFQEFTANPSLYLLKANNLNDVANKTTAFNNLSPNTTTGDITYFNGTNNVRLAANTTSTVQYLQSVNSVPSYSTIPTAGLTTYFFINTASDIGGYFIQQQAPSTTAGQTQSFTGLATGTDTTLVSFATPTGFPNLTFIPPGVTTAYLTAVQSSGSRTVQLYANMYSRTSGGSETLLSTTALTAPITGVTAAYIFQGVIPSIVSLNTTDRLVTKIVARVSAGAGPSVNVTITMQDATSARTEFPASAVDTTVFVPYTGALSDVNLGSHNLTTSGTLTGSNLSGTNTGDVTLTAVGASPSANGASLSGQALTLQPFDSTHPGVVTASGGGTINFLRADGTFAVPPGTGSVNNWTVTSQTSTYAVLTSDTVVLVSGGVFTVTLPTAVGVTGKLYIIKKTDSSLTNIITIATTSSQTIGTGPGSGTTRTLNTQDESYSIYSDGSNWQVEEHYTLTSWSSSTASNISALSAYTFTIPASSVTAGAIYSNNGQQFTVTITIVSGTTLTAAGTGAPSGTGTLTLVSGTGPGTISFSASTTAGEPVKGTVVTDSMVWRRVGSNMQLRFTYAQTTASGTAGTGDYVVYLPTGLVANTSILTPIATAGDLHANGPFVTSYFSASGTVQGTSGAFSAIIAGGELFSATAFRICFLFNVSGMANWAATHGQFSLATNMSLATTIELPMSGWTD